jgi:hypothetical protein
MKVLVLINGELEEKVIGAELEDLQEIVGGYIEIPYLGDTFRNNGIDVIINDEGKFIEGLKPEIAIVSENTGAILDIVYGNCIFASHDEMGNTIGLNDEQINIVKMEIETVIELMDKNTLKEFDVRVLFI